MGVRGRGRAWARTRARVGAEAEAEAEVEAGVEAEAEVAVEGSRRASHTASGLSVTRLAYQRPVERRCSARSGQRMDMPIVEK